MGVCVVLIDPFARTRRPNRPFLDALVWLCPSLGGVKGEGCKTDKSTWGRWEVRGPYRALLVTRQCIGWVFCWALEGSPLCALRCTCMRQRSACAWSSLHRACCCRFSVLLCVSAAPLVRGECAHCIGHRSS